MFLDPKAEFLKTPKLADKLAGITNDPEFRQCCMWAMQEYVRKLNGAQDGSGAAACAYRTEGAQGFMNTLLSLHEPPPKPKPVTGASLNYNATQ